MVHRGFWNWRIGLRTRIQVAESYGSRILQMAKFFNSGIEKIVYEPPVRNRIGLAKAGTVYTSPAWSMNVVYARLKPSGPLKTLLLTCILGVFRLSARLLYWFSEGRPGSETPTNSQFKAA